MSLKEKRFEASGFNRNKLAVLFLLDSRVNIIVSMWCVSYETSQLTAN